MSRPHGELAAWLVNRLADPLGLEGAIVCLSDNWRSEVASHRLQIREALVETLCATSPVDDLSHLLDLREIPRSAGHQFSISHCPDLGGFFVSVDCKKAIGFDIEIASRITTAVAARVLPHPSESGLRARLNDSKDSSVSTFIWAAKESAIKCFGNALTKNALNYADVEIVALELNQNLDFDFKARFKDHSACGIAAAHGDHVFALAVYISS